MKWLAPTLAYLAVGLGLFVFHSAWGALVGFHLAILISLAIARPDIPISILFKNKRFLWVGLSVLLCGSSGISLYFLWNQLGFAHDLPTQVQSLGLNARTWPTFIAYFVLVNPFVEEYFWRGYWGSKTRGLYVSDFIYAGFHAMILIDKVPPASILLTLTLLVLAGWFWRQILREDGGLLAPVLGHMLADLTILLTVFLKVT